MTMRTKPEWPGAGQKEVRWEFPYPITIYTYSLFEEGVRDWIGEKGSLIFGPHAQHKRAVGIHTSGRSRYDGHYRYDNWPEDGWLVVVRGRHPLNQKEIIEHRGGASIHSGYERMELVDFEQWLLREQYEILVDFRDAVIADGWRPTYAGCGVNRVPPDHLAHWYPERTVLTCSATREEWAESRRNHYLLWGEYGQRFARVSNKPSDYVTPAEVATLVASLKQQRLDLLRKEQHAKKQYPHLFQRKDETRTEYTSRWLAMSRADQDLASELETSRERRELSQAIKALATDGGIPWRGDDGGYLPEMKRLQELRQVAQEREEARLREQGENDFPIDDAAWAEEVARREAEEAERQRRLQWWSKKNAIGSH